MGGGDREHHAGRRVQLLRRPRGGEDRRQRGVPADALHLVADAHARRVQRRPARPDRRAGHAAVTVLRAGQPPGPRVRRQGQPPRRVDAPRLDGVRCDPRAVAPARDGGGGRRRRDARRADARLEPDRHAQSHRSRAERPRRHRLRHGGRSSSCCTASCRDVPAVDPRPAGAPRHRPGAHAPLLPRAGGRARLRTVDPCGRRRWS